MTSDVLALAGGVGGAKLALGLVRILDPQELVIIANTGDDETFYGLQVSPDLDTLMYTLAGLANPTTGWGQEDESFNALDMLRRYGADTWFTLGDRDLATHIERSRLLRQGWSLSEVTRHLCDNLGIRHTLAPMSDQPVHTIIETDQGDLAFQDYFVKLQCEPPIRGIHFEGVQAAHMSLAFQQALSTAASVIFCPSNPVVSIGPILALPGVREHLTTFQGLRIAVSPLVGERAIHGPAAKMLRELGEDVSCVGVARRLLGICDVLVIDKLDAHRASDVQSLGMDAVVLNTIMETDTDKERLAQEILWEIRSRIER